MTRYNRYSDEELLKMLRASDHYAYTEIYNRYHYMLLQHAYTKLGDEEQAKDVVQELFVNLWLRRESEMNAVNLAGYLYKATRNKILDIFAHQKVRENHVQASLNDFASNYSYADTDHLVLEKELSAYIERQVQALPRKMREIYELSRKGHYSHREIAEMLDTSEANVSKQMTNAIRILRKKTDTFIIIYFIYNSL